MEAFLIMLGLFAVAALLYFVVYHRDTFESLIKSDVEKVRDEAKEAEDKFRAAMRRFDDEARENLKKKVKKIRARRK